MAFDKKSNVISENEASPTKKYKSQSSPDTEVSDSLETSAVLPLAAVVVFPASSIGSNSHWHFEAPP